MLRCSKELSLLLVGAAAISKTVNVVAPPEDHLQPLAIGADVSLQGICDPTAVRRINSDYFPITNGRQTFAVDIINPQIRQKLSRMEASVGYRQLKTNIPGLTTIEATVDVDNGGDSLENVRRLRGNLFCLADFASEINRRARITWSTLTAPFASQPNNLRIR